MGKWAYKIKKIVVSLISEEVFDLIRMIKKIDSKEKIILWFIFAPITLLYLLENFFIYIIFLTFFNLKLFKKIIKQKIFKEKKIKKIVYKKSFIKIENGFLVLIKNMLLDLPKLRAFTVFYLINKKIFNYKKNEFNKKELINSIKIILNRYLIVLILGFPYLLLYCNTWLTNKLVLLYKIKKIENMSFYKFIFFLLLNINRDLTPVSVLYIKKLKIKFYRNKIIFNPKEKNITKLILELINKHEFNKNSKILLENSYIDMVQNIIEVNNKGEIKLSKPHLETKIILNEKNPDETISINETSQDTLFGNKNFFFGNCTFKKGNCFVTKPILSKLEYKRTIKDTINYKILNSNWDSVSYNQILALICQLESSYLEGVWIQKENRTKFILQENKNSNLMNFIRSKKEILNKNIYEAFENSNNFFNETNKIYENLNEVKKGQIINNNIYGALIKNNNSIFQLLKQ